MSIVCSECNLYNDEENNYCIRCGHKMKNISVNNEFYKEYCVYCGRPLKKDENFCGYCGKEKKQKKKIKVCPVCGEWCGSEKYCWNCGHDNYKFINILSIFCSKKCPNCNAKYRGCFDYCNECGTKLTKRYI